MKKCKFCRMVDGHHSHTCGDHYCFEHGMYYLPAGTTGPCPACARMDERVKAAVREALREAGVT